MKETYQECVSCKNLSPLLSYFLSKEEYIKLNEREKRLCFWCYQTKHAWENKDCYKQVKALWQKLHI